MTKTESAKAILTYKDTVFRMLFRDRERLLELYNAISDSHYTDSALLELVTLENAVYMNVKNDLAFLIDFHLYLYEHQSTVNPNMPFRFLQYVTREYEKLTRDSSLYGGSLIRLPTPRFVVFYNGLQPWPEADTLKLSNAFPCQDSSPQLELTVQVFNINYGTHKPLLEQCRALREYAQYVDCVRQYSACLPIHEAVTQAVDVCIQNGILSDFLKANKAEVMSMSIFEYDEEAARKAMQNTFFEQGKEAGLAEGKKAGLAEGKETGLRLAKEIFALRDAGLSIQEIASQVQLSAEDIKKLLC